MWLRAGSHQLVLPAEREDIVPKDVFLAVMLMKARALAPENDVAFEHNARASFVGIKAPTSVRERIDVMNQIVSHHRSGLRAKHVNGPHVTESAQPDMVEVIILDQVPVAGRFTISPG